jgi:hypothetical protein
MQHRFARRLISVRFEGCQAPGVSPRELCAGSWNELEAPDTIYSHRMPASRSLQICYDTGRVAARPSGLASSVVWRELSTCDPPPCTVHSKLTADASRQLPLPKRSERAISMSANALMGYTRWSKTYSFGCVILGHMSGVTHVDGAACPGHRRSRFYRLTFVRTTA